MKEIFRVAMMQQHNEAIKELKNEKMVLKALPLHDEAVCDREEFCLYTILRGLVSGTPTVFQSEMAAIMLANVILDMGAEAEAGRGRVVLVMVPDPEEGGGGSIH